MTIRRLPAPAGMRSRRAHLTPLPDPAPRPLDPETTADASLPSNPHGISRGGRPTAVNHDHSAVYDHPTIYGDSE